MSSNSGQSSGCPPTSRTYWASKRMEFGGGNGKRYSHILPQEKYQLNILPSFRAKFWLWISQQNPRIQLHSDFHHLNSSQALCFNLFSPMLRNNGQGLASLLGALGIAGLLKIGAYFEFQPDLTEGTCIDFSLPLQSGARVNFEIKYTESEFGSAEGDGAHMDKFERTYRPRLTGRFVESFCCATRFLEHYQIARNVWHLNESAGDVAVFLFPRANTRLRRQEAIIKGCALEPFRSRFGLCTWRTSSTISGKLTKLHRESNLKSSEPSTFRFQECQQRKKRLPCRGRKVAVTS